MNGGICLSCEAIERYLGEEEERAIVAMIFSQDPKSEES